MRPSKPRHVNISVYGNVEHNTGIHVAIGSLVISWANNESVFMALLQALLDAPPMDAAILWHAHRNTQARLELVYALARHLLTGSSLLGEIEKAIGDFKGLSRTRNLYCHAIYEYDDDKKLRGVHGIQASQDGDPLRFEDKRFTPATINEIQDATMRMFAMNKRLWGIVVNLTVALKTQHVVLPQWLHSDQPSQATHHPKDTAQEPPQPSSPSAE